MLEGVLVFLCDEFVALVPLVLVGFLKNKDDIMNVCVGEGKFHSGKILDTRYGQWNGRPRNNSSISITINCTGITNLNRVGSLQAVTGIQLCPLPAVTNRCSLQAVTGIRICPLPAVTNCRCFQAVETC